ncbi:hypothetical protein K435DRAFT_699858 [Dendrothele bispora CBS 962.96]|uniref:Ubiquitin 3 binding protein But2 C-terminal domain-containing protein n=1 Tax=Dendrothele bispora (strain CBS 962.96) TaxID=1314807 RepID=A0A4S8KRW7_DENBC|nr:hypothetical protein K435DRAFT_699858 [Dendrothele bispora CBS 962.96]
MSCCNLLCAVIGILLVLRLQQDSPFPKTGSDPLAFITPEQIRNLKRPSLYIGLESIPRPVPPIPRSLVNFPQIIARVDARQTDLVFDDDPLRYMTNTGMVSPEERKVSTLFQFRAIDFGMETCELIIRFTTPEFKMNSYPLSLYRLEGNSTLNTKILSYNNRPTRTGHVGDIQVTSSGHSVQWNTTFACRWDELLLFELTCGGNEESPVKSQDARCEVEWWQGKKDKDPTNGTSTFLPFLLTLKFTDPRS